MSRSFLAPRDDIDGGQRNRWFPGFYGSVCGPQSYSRVDAHKARKGSSPCPMISMFTALVFAPIILQA